MPLFATQSQCDGRPIVAEHSVFESDGNARRSRSFYTTATSTVLTFTHLIITLTQASRMHQNAPFPEKNEKYSFNPFPRSLPHWGRRYPSPDSTRSALGVPVPFHLRLEHWEPHHLTPNWPTPNCTCWWRAHIVDLSTVVT